MDFVTIVSQVTMIVGFAGAMYLMTLHDSMSRMLAGLFMVTGFFGLANMLSFELDHALYPIRLVIMGMILYMVWTYQD